MAIDGGRAYLGGSFGHVGGQARTNAAAVDLASGAVAPWDPHGNGPVYALAVSGGTVYAGGTFTAIGDLLRNRIAALDTSLGFATAWNPGASDRVEALVVRNGLVYTSGLFQAIGGQSRRYLAALDATSGLATGWNPTRTPRSRRSPPHGSILYVGGAFSTVGGQPRGRIAALDEASGTPTTMESRRRGIGLLDRGVRRGDPCRGNFRDDRRDAASLSRGGRRHHARRAPVESRPRRPDQCPRPVRIDAVSRAAVSARSAASRASRWGRSTRAPASPPHGTRDSPAVRPMSSRSRRMAPFSTSGNVLECRRTAAEQPRGPRRRHRGRHRFQSQRHWRKSTASPPTAAPGLCGRMVHRGRRVGAFPPRGDGCLDRCRRSRLAPRSRRRPLRPRAERLKLFFGGIFTHAGGSLPKQRRRGGPDQRIADRLESLGGKLVQGSGPRMVRCSTSAVVVSSPRATPAPVSRPRGIRAVGREPAAILVDGPRVYVGGLVQQRARSHALQPGGAVVLRRARCPRPSRSVRS